MSVPTVETRFLSAVNLGQLLNGVRALTGPEGDLLWTAGKDDVR